jgi:hypothetical protein
MAILRSGEAYILNARHCRNCTALPGFPNVTAMSLPLNETDCCQEGGRFRGEDIMSEHHYGRHGGERSADSGSGADAGSTTLSEHAQHLMRDAQTALANRNATPDQKLHAVEALAEQERRENAPLTLDFLDKGNNLRHLNLDLEITDSGKKLVHVFADGDGRARPVLRGVDEGNGTFSKETDDNTGKQVGYYGDWWGANRKDSLLNGNENIRTAPGDSAPPAVTPIPDGSASVPPGRDNNHSPLPADSFSRGEMAKQFVEQVHAGNADQVSRRLAQLSPEDARSLATLMNTKDRERQDARHAASWNPFHTKDPSLHFNYENGRIVGVREATKAEEGGPTGLQAPMGPNEMGKWLYLWD